MVLGCGLKSNSFLKTVLNQKFAQFCSPQVNMRLRRKNVINSCQYTRQLAQKLKDENGEGHIVIVEDGQEQQLETEEKAAFEKLLPLASKQVSTLRHCLIRKKTSPNMIAHPLLTYLVFTY